MSELKRPMPGREPGVRKGPLAEIRVADFCWMGVGSIATRFLGDYGAEVIKIENRKRLDTPRRLPIYKGVVRSYGEEDADPDPDKGGLHNNYSRNKLGITVDMGSAEGREIVDRLIGASSVVTENFAPGVMERWGLTYDRLTELSPDVIFARMSGFGHSGPYESYRSYGPVVQAACGLSFISGLPDMPPSGWGFSYMDNMAAYYNSAAVLMAVYNRLRTGRGTEIDVSAVEAGIGILGPVFLETSVNGRNTRAGAYPTGNRPEHLRAAPHGVYPTDKPDRWLAIAAFDEADWRTLCGVMARPDLAGDSRFATLALRLANQDALDVEVSRWTRTVDLHDAGRRLVEAGLCGGPVQNAQDLNEVDPQLAHRGIFFEMDHPVIGEARFEGEPMLFSRTKPDNWRSAPLLGEDNFHVYRNILGMPDDQIADYADRGII